MLDLKEAKKKKHCLSSAIILEKVFDRILAEHLVPYNIEIICAVKNQSIINDATLKEAYESGLDDCILVLSPGSDAPGTIPENCNNDFLDVFYQVDLVISKGQGNYKALSDCTEICFFSRKQNAQSLLKNMELL